MSKRLLIFFGIGVVAIAIAVVVILSANKGSHLQLQGKILKVRTGALGEGNSIAVMDFRVENPSDMPFVVRTVDISAGKEEWRDGGRRHGIQGRSEAAVPIQPFPGRSIQRRARAYRTRLRRTARWIAWWPAHFEVSERGSGEGQGGASEHPGCGWSAVGDQPRASTKLRLRRLIIRPGGIGDCILSLPAIEHLRAEYHRSLGSFGDRSVDSFCGGAGDCVDGDRFARACRAWSRRRA